MAEPGRQPRHYHSGPREELANGKGLTQAQIREEFGVSKRTV
jgi:hypothetical protein